jgi:hypothetical protein
VAHTTHSLGNIRCTPGYACLDGYRAYATWGDGARDWFVLIRSLYLDTWHLRTPAAILPRYAPPGDGNDPATYAASVIQLVDGWTRRPPCPLACWRAVPARAGTVGTPPEALKRARKYPPPVPRHVGVGALS